jgi:peptidoglycan/LPS O-acetylase OafA/YrhL
MLRAIAALLVVAFHTPIILGLPVAALPLSSLVRSSYRGVDLFFVLSGFIIAHVHAVDIGRPGRWATTSLIALHASIPQSG